MNESSQLSKIEVKPLSKRKLIQLGIFGKRHDIEVELTVRQAIELAALLSAAVVTVRVHG